MGEEQRAIDAVLLGVIGAKNVIGASRGGRWKGGGGGGEGGGRLRIL